jgi:hypothetical protein
MILLLSGIGEQPRSGFFRLGPQIREYELIFAFVQLVDGLGRAGCATDRIPGSGQNGLQG